jgi:hypothetical protein
MGKKRHGLYVGIGEYLGGRGVPPRRQLLGVAEKLKW